MAWYDNGLQGSNGGVAWPVSGGINQPAIEALFTGENIYGPAVCGSIALGSNSSGSYTVLLNTFSTGAQIYDEITPEPFNTTLYLNETFPAVPARAVWHKHNFYMKKGQDRFDLYDGQSQTAWSYLVETGSGLQENLFSIYGYGYWKAQPTNEATFEYQTSFPRGGQDAGMTNQYAAVRSGNDIDFYAIGRACEVGPFPGGNTKYRFDAPCSFLFRIPESLLNNPALFDPNNDSFTPTDTGDGDGGGGNIPGLPISDDYPGDNIDFPDLPTGANAFGFSRLTMYKPTDSNLADALDILYTDSDESTLETIIESCKKWWYKPEQYCISLMISPVDATASNSKTIKFGKYDSEVYAPYLSSQYHIVDCGYIDVPLKFGSFVDFEPYAKAKIYLPYVGFRSININEIMGGRIAIKYYVDMLTGSAVCMMKVSKPSSNTSVLYTYECNVATQIPLTSNNYDTVVSNLLQAGVSAGMVAAGIATGGAASAPAVFAGASGAAQSVIGAGSSAGSPEMTQCGQLTSNTGVMCVPYPYIAIQMPVPTTPSNYTSEKGRPSNIFMPLRNCSGFTVISDLHIDIPGAYGEEINQIRDAFRRGVYM